MKISDFTETISAGLDSVLPIVLGGLNRKISIENFKKAMMISGDDVSYDPQNNLDGGNDVQGTPPLTNVQNALATMAVSVNELAREGVATADLVAAVANYFTENPIEQYSYRITRDSETGTYTLLDINDNPCGTITPSQSINKNSLAVPTNKAVYNLVNVGESNVVMATNSSGMPIATNVTKANLQNLVTDTGWIDHTDTGRSFGGYFKLFNNELDVQYRRVGNLVSIRGTLTASKLIPNNGSTKTMFNLDNGTNTGFRPARACVFVCQGSGRKTWTMQVSTTGEVTFDRYGGDTLEDCPKDAWLPFNVCYLVN